MLSISHKVFLEVAAKLSFSRASQVLFISQPAISKHIKSLESYYKSPLFNRKGNLISLTDSGKILLAYLQDALMIQRQVEFELSTLTDQAQAMGQLKLGASTTVALYILPKILSGFHRQYPELNIQLMNRNSENITNALLNREIDLGIIEVENKITSIAYQYFMTDEVIAVCSAHSKLVGQKEITLSSLTNIPVALREQGSGTLNALTLSLQKNGIDISAFQVKIRLGGTEALKNFVIADTCLGFLPRKSVLRELKSGELIHIKIPNLVIKRDFFFIQPQGLSEFLLTKQFIRFARLFDNL